MPFEDFEIYLTGISDKTLLSKIMGLRMTNDNDIRDANLLRAKHQFALKTVKKDINRKIEEAFFPMLDKQNEEDNHG